MFACVLYKKEISDSDQFEDYGEDIYIIYCSGFEYDDYEKFE